MGALASQALQMLLMTFQTPGQTRSELQGGPRRRRRRGQLALLVGACVGLGSAPTATADIYRYVDKHGVEHYTNVPSGRGNYQLVFRSRPSSKRALSGSGRTRARRAPDPGRLSRYDDHIREAAALYKLPEAFIRAVVRVESNFYRDAVSHKGAMGLMQLMPATASAMGVADPFEPRQNVLGGARFLRVLANQFNGDLVLTIAAYNAGHGAVRKYNGVPPYRETRRYVRRVLEHYYGYRASHAALDGSNPAGR